MKKVIEMVQSIAVEMGSEAGMAAGDKVGVEEVAKIDWKTITGDKIAEIRKQFEVMGASAGSEASTVLMKSSIVAKISMEAVLETAKVASIQAAEKYSIKAREFCKMAVKISEEAGGKVAAEMAKTEG